MKTNLPTGSRITYSDPFSGKRMRGLVIGEHFPAGHSTTTDNRILICSDIEYDQKRLQRIMGKELEACGANYAGLGHGLYLPINNLKSSADISGLHDTWKGVPKHIGVVVDRNICDAEGEIILRAGETGRVVFWHGKSVLVSWHHPFKLAYDKYGMPNCFRVHSSYLLVAKFFLLKRGASKDLIYKSGYNGNRIASVTKIWPNCLVGNTPFIIGDYVKFTKPISCRMNHPDGHLENIKTGTILKITKEAPDELCYCVEVVGGCHSAAIGCTGVLKREALTVIAPEVDFLETGTEVEIIATITFRGRALQNLKGRVLLPADEDDEVGIEFEKDVNGGSLDGLGRDRCCLYLPRGAIKKVSG